MKAIILAGGRGKRLKPVTDYVPKPLVPIKNIPIIEWQIRYLKKFGINEVIICTGYKADMIESYLSMKKLGMKIKFSIEKTPLGTGGAIKKAGKYPPPPKPLTPPPGMEGTAAGAAGSASAEVLDGTISPKKKISIPILAPSANKSGGVSPTSAQHVKEDFSPNFKGKGWRLNKILDYAPVRCSVTIMYATSSTNNSSLLAEAYFVAFFQNFSFLVDP